VEHAPHDYDGGLSFDLPILIGRRRMLALVGGAGIAALVGCGSDDDSSQAGAASTSGGDTTSAGSSATSAGATAVSGTDTTATTATGAAVSDAECSTIPEETAGPFPGDGSNGPNVLAESGVVRRDIRSSFGSFTGVAEGVPLTVQLTVVGTADGCTPLPGAAVYAWHCDREGRYSLYSEGVTEENYLRGVQEADSNGIVTFTSIFPGCYQGRWPHIHFEVYRSLADATAGGSAAATSQLAFPQDTCDVVYASSGYEQSVSNLAQLSLETDGIFSDGVDQQMATMSGSVDGGFTAALAVPI
jgi:protocatechuate 3,4-dioxygenase beta subunit